MASTEDWPEMYPLLKVSPPIPVGRLAGRFKLQLWRAGLDFQLMLPLAKSAQGELTVIADACHLGVHEGDEVLSINDVAVQDVSHAAEILEQSGQDVEIHFYHKEFEMCEDQLITETTCCATPPFCSWRVMPVWCDVFYNPPEPRCRPESWQLREVLSASKVQELPGKIWRLHMERSSMKQSFALPLGMLCIEPEASEMSNLASEDGLLPSPRVNRTTALPVCDSFGSEDGSKPLEVPQSPMTEPVEQEQTEITIEGSPKNVGAIILLQSMPLLGLRRGDELYRVNGQDVNSIETWKAATKHVMKLTLDFHRKQMPEVAASPLKIPDRRRSEDWHSVSSTKDCSRECSHNDDSTWSTMLYKSSCRPGQNSVETLDAITSRTGTSTAKISDTQDVLFL